MAWNGYGAGAMSRIHDVAKAAGVSIMTVSRYFNRPDALAPDTFERVRAAVEELKYVPNASARSLIRGRSEILALVVSDITNPFFTTLARGVEDEAQENGYTLILGNTDETLEKERSYVDVLISRRVDGVLLSPAQGEHHGLDLLARHAIPVVLIDREVAGAEVDVVKGDSFGGGYALTRHLIDAGHERIAFVGGPSGVSSLEERLAGYRAAMRAADLADVAHLGRYDRTSGEEAAAAALTERAAPFTALVAANNQVALGVMTWLRRHGVRVPDDISVACFEDVDSDAAPEPFMTIVRQPAYDIGRVATRRLLERIGGFDGGPRSDVLPVELVVRRSVRNLADRGRDVRSDPPNAVGR